MNVQKLGITHVQCLCVMFKKHLIAINCVLCDVSGVCSLSACKLLIVIILQYAIICFLFTFDVSGSSLDQTQTEILNLCVNR
jgi:hypothetical protein